VAQEARAQTPAEHPGVPLATEQASPQEPQLALLVLVLTSQPLLYRPSQSAYPRLHDASEHAPPVHAGVPRATAHALPQLPQFGALLLVSVSQPLVALPSQLRQVPVQTGMHTLPEQLVVPCAFEHTVPQAPQFETLLLASVSQPLVASLSQLRQVPVQTGTHTLPEQLVVPCAFEHTVPQAPQFGALLVVLVSQPSAYVPLQSA
jgi:hypothetical protein